MTLSLRKTGAGAAILIFIGPWLARLTFRRRPQIATARSPQRKRPRMSTAELEEAYREAYEDPAYVAHVRGVSAAFDGTVGDGLSVASSR